MWREYGEIMCFVWRTEKGLPLAGPIHYEKRRVNRTPFSVFSSA